MAGRGFVQPIAGAGERRAEKLPNRKLVFDQQHEWRRWRTWITRSRKRKTRRHGFSAAARRRARRCETRPRLRGGWRPKSGRRALRQSPGKSPGPGRRRGGRPARPSNRGRTCRRFSVSLPGGTPGPLSATRISARLADDCGRDLDRAVGRRVARRILQQIHEHLLQQETRRPSSSGKSLGMSTRTSWSFELPLHGRQRQADDLFQHVPLPIQRDRAGIEPGHVEQIVDQPRQPLRFVDDRFAATRDRSSVARVRASSRPRRRSSPAASADRATPSSRANCGAARPGSAVAPDGRRAPIRRVRSTARSGWHTFPAGVAARDRESGSTSFGRTPSAPTVRCEPTSGTNRAVALGSVSVPAPATLPFCVTHWATTALTGCWATDVALAKAQRQRPGRLRKKQHDFAVEDLRKLPAGGADQKLRARQLAQLPRHAVELRRCGAPAAARPATVPGAATSAR